MVPQDCPVDGPVKQAHESPVNYSKGQQADRNKYKKL